MTVLQTMAMAVAFFAGVLLLPSAVRTAAVPILEPIAPSVSGRLALGEMPNGTARRRVMGVNLYALPTPGTAARSQEDDVELALFPDVTLRAVFDRFDTVAGSGTWVGHVEGRPLSSVTLAYDGGLLTANINDGSRLFSVRPLPEDDQPRDAARPLHIVSEIQASSVSLGEDTAEPSWGPSREVPPNAAMGGDSADGDTVIDLLVVYTPSAMNRAGGPTGVANKIALGVADANAAYVNSRIPMTLRVVHTALMPYTENPNALILDDLGLGRGAFAGVAALRNQHGADLVMLLADMTGFTYGGIAAFSTLPDRGEAYGYSVVGDSDDLFAVHVVAHELGHNLGARHDWFVDSAPGRPGAPDYAHGYVDVSRRFQTIMSYFSHCAAAGVACSPINWFSNPDDYFPRCSGTSFNCDLLRYWLWDRFQMGRAPDAGTGCRAGVIPSSPCVADNRRVLIEHAPIVANYRQSR